MEPKTAPPPHLIEAAARARAARKLNQLRRWAEEMRAAGWSVKEPGAGRVIPDYIKLSGDEECGVDLMCYRDSCDPYDHGALAYYGDPTAAGVSFATTELGGFLDFIEAHATMHEAEK